MRQTAASKLTPANSVNTIRPMAGVGNDPKSHASSGGRQLNTLRVG